MAHANDNTAPISGKAAAQWLALARAIKDGRMEDAKTLRLFERLYELANTPPEAIPSIADAYEDDHDLDIAAEINPLRLDERGKTVIGIESPRHTTAR
jgi:hypothetical protein